MEQALGKVGYTAAQSRTLHELYGRKGEQAKQGLARSLEPLTNPSTRQMQVNVDTNDTPISSCATAEPNRMEIVDHGGGAVNELGRFLTKKI
jgi:hypothetical protein